MIALEDPYEAALAVAPLPMSLEAARARLRGRFEDKFDVEEEAHDDDLFVAAAPGGDWRPAAAARLRTGFAEAFAPDAAPRPTFDLPPPRPDYSDDARIRIRERFHAKFSA